MVVGISTTVLMAFKGTVLLELIKKMLELAAAESIASIATTNLTKAFIGLQLLWKK